jgi:hypothetical protein
VVGLFLGLLLAKGLFRLFNAVGFTLPNSGLLFQTRTIVVALAVGIMVTLVASLRPALRATRVPPIAAVREGATLPPGRFARFRTLGAAIVAALGFALLAYGIFASGLGTAKVLIFMLVGALLIFIGVAMFSSWLVGPLAAGANPVARWAVFVFAILVWPFWSLPFWLLRVGAFGPGSVGRRVGFFILGAVLNPLLLLAVLVMRLRAAVTRWRPEWPAEFPACFRMPPRPGSEARTASGNPQRTASTAAALMIGLALVTLVATLAAGIIAPFRGAVNDLFTADYAITAQNNFSPIPPSVAVAAAKARGVEEVTSIRGGDGRAFGKTIQVTATEPNVAKVITSTKWKEGSAAVLARLGSDGAFVTPGFAKSHNLHIGSPLELLTPTGKRLPCASRPSTSRRPAAPRSAR